MRLLNDLVFAFFWWKVKVVENEKLKHANSHINFLNYLDFSPKERKNHFYFAINNYALYVTENLMEFL
jgi:hypothetical protein